MSKVRSLFVLPKPKGFITKYDLIQMIIGNNLSSSILVEHDTLTKTLFSYIFEQDTFIKTLTNIQVDHDTLIKVLVNFNYEVNQDTLIKIIGSQPIPPSTFFGTGGGHIKVPVGKVYKKKKKADQIIKLDKLNISNLLSRKIIQVRISALFEIKLTVGDKEFFI